ncbi:acetoin utilization protein [Actibacterium mucosum KCTC 23349]|uniref:Acetoin utilization protein n=1 Tax=Actibacterium mucosum KCTC 23349 TaxID=1454373 RepID=A0A037ZNA8_9RHOB|nr:histone deacetylase family protein [Actibacterium mucosum]KAJ57140.1 acetoin utilization protein [Actibacterium mucosum KCTC 23349]
MTTLLITSPHATASPTPPGHPERIARVEAVLDRLSTPEFDALNRVQAVPATPEQIALAHPPDYLPGLQAACEGNALVALDADTFISDRALAAALDAVGGNIQAVDAVMSGAASNAFVACRPPGHHAEKTRAMGFCLLGNVAIAALHALTHHGLDRVAIMDFDVHHGNGTQDILWDERRVLFASTHQMPLYPGSGAPDEAGAHDNILNVPLPPGSDGQTFRTRMEGAVLPALDRFAPQLLLISAGFDAHRDDPLAGLNWVADDFAWATRHLCDIADTHCGGKVVSTLEGGYDLSALADSAAAHIQVLMERGT